MLSILEFIFVATSHKLCAFTITFEQRLTIDKHSVCNSLRLFMISVRISNEYNIKAIKHTRVLLRFINSTFFSLTFYRWFCIFFFKNQKARKMFFLKTFKDAFKCQALCFNYNFSLRLIFFFFTNS